MHRAVFPTIFPGILNNTPEETYVADHRNRTHVPDRAIVA